MKAYVIFSSIAFSYTSRHLASSCLNKHPLIRNWEKERYLISNMWLLAFNNKAIVEIICYGFNKKRVERFRVVADVIYYEYATTALNFVMGISEEKKYGGKGFRTKNF